MERRMRVGERRKAKALPLPAERRSKPRRKLRKLVGSPPPNATRIDVSDQYELRYWSKELGVSDEAIRSAVQDVGATLEAVRKHLGK